MKRYLLPLSLSALLSGCTPPPPPHNMNNACAIFAQYPSWRSDALNAEKEYGVPIATQLAIIYQESRFNPDNRPPRTHLLWIIPWFRSTTAFGYTQSLDMTWRRFQNATGSYAANRDNFSDATDFIGWYADMTLKRLNHRYLNAKDLYLAYHEGVGGYIRGTYRHKRWLITVANRVQHRANRYHAQLLHCSYS